MIVLGAGASLAAFPSGERGGLSLPLMRNLVEIVGLGPVLDKFGIAHGITDFESFYDDIATNRDNPAPLCEVEHAIHGYFSRLALPDEATLYDYLLLCLRKKDLIATFNWDPFLAQAYRRNAHLEKLPKIVFLHGNVEIGTCRDHNGNGFVSQNCKTCGKPLAPSKLLYPVRNKDYNKNAFIKNEWIILPDYIKRAYYITIFGYSAPVTDAEAIKIMSDEWKNNTHVKLSYV